MITPPTTNSPLPNKRELTFGEKLVGITFNPSDDSMVYMAKGYCAQLADLLRDEVLSNPNDISELKMQLYNHAITEILNAQMNVVKVLTLKY